MRSSALTACAFSYFTDSWGLIRASNTQPCIGSKVGSSGPSFKIYCLRAKRSVIANAVSSRNLVASLNKTEAACSVEVDNNI